MFEKIIWKHEAGQGNGVNSMVFSVPTNSNRVVSLIFSKVYEPIIEWEDTYYNFNSGNGELIVLSELFGEKGFMEFKKIVINQRIKQLNELNNLKDSNSPVLNYQSELIDNFKSDELKAFMIKDTTVFIFLDHFIANKYDEEWIKEDVVGSIDFSLFSGFLNEYGKAVFGITNDSISKYHSKNLTLLGSGK
jgi:hypothetical protein